MNALQFGFGRQLPMLQQTETAECGATCLAMISSYYGHHVDMMQMRAKLHTSIKGTTLKELVRFADELNLASRAVKLEIEDLPQLQAPCILHWDMDHYVVLKSANAHRIVIHDPAYGVRKMTLQEASKHFSGVAMELSPTPSFEEKKPEKSVSLKTLLGNAVGLKRALFQILALSVALEFLSLTGPLFQQWVLDSVVIHNDIDLLKVLSLGFFMLMLLQLCISTLRNWMVIYFSTQINIQWASGVLTKLLRLPIDYFGRRHLGDVMSRFGSIQAIRETLTSAALNAILDGLMGSVAFIMMWIYSPKLALITLVASSLYLIVRISSYPAFRAVSEEQIIHSARQDSNLLETVRGVQSIKLFNRESDRRNQWLNLLINTTNRELASQRLSTLFQVANTLIFGIENILVVYVGAVLIMNNELTIGMSFAYAAYKLQFSSRISALVDLFFQFRMLTIQRERLADIVLTESEPQGGNGMPELGIPDIELRNIRFRYANSEPWVLDGISLKIDAGETVAIVGPSGCGKTTLLKIMLGLLQPTEGEILIMGQPLSSIGLSAWRDAVGAVMQEDQLFAGTIAENIAFFAPQIDYKRVHECSAIAAIDKDILGMPLTWQTLIGDMGAALSGGQKQRILLARALYKEPRILLLDEATSHLDIAREQSVNEAIRALSITKVVIAHRQETINMADRVITI